MSQFKAPYISKGELVKQAESFLQEHHPSRDLPIPIENIVEFRFNLDIVPVPGLHNYDIVAYITHDQKEIRVDQYVLESRTNRYRFSLAHELGHLILHPELFEYLKFRDAAEWKNVMTTSIPEKEYRYLEFHANFFAGLVLVPQNELSYVLEKCRAKAAHYGLDLEDQYDGGWEAIEEYIGREFLVSSAVIHRRLEYDGLR
ncbi:MAG: ImmA/IrrE family metallo-endopeptidase [Planctomycetota bacterium]